MKHKLAVFVSGGGTDLQCIIDSINSNYIDNAEIALVIGSKNGIYALERAKKEKISTKVFDKNDFKDLNEMFEKIIIELKKEEIEYIILAGYLLILCPNIIEKYRNRIINIHPSLIPKYCGDGFYGMKVHKAVIEAKEKESGATVHFVDEGTDTGKIILQESIQVSANDTPEILQRRVLELEHKLLPKAIKKILNGEKNEKESID